jgi:hypothetical protein
VDSHEPSEFGKWLSGLMEDRGSENLKQITSCTHEAGFMGVTEETLDIRAYDNALYEMLERESLGPGAQACSASQRGGGGVAHGRTLHRRNAPWTGPCGKPRPFVAFCARRPPTEKYAVWPLRSSENANKVVSAIYNKDGSSGKGRLLNDIDGIDGISACISTVYRNSADSGLIG